MQELIRRRFDESVATTRAAQERLGSAIAAAAQLIVACYKAGGGVFLFGNGGSASDAQHIACELVGRFMKERRALRAQALTADASVLSAVANDYDFARVFARQIEACARPGDVAVGLSTSGNSPNVVAGLETARRLGLKTVAMTGRGGGRCGQLADVLLDVPADSTPRVQEAHTVIYHILCEIIEQAVSAEA